MSPVTRMPVRPHHCGLYVPTATAPEDAPTGAAEPVSDTAVHTGSEHEGPAPADTEEPAACDGRTQWVRTLELEVAEREEIAALQAQRAATHVESEATLRLRQESADAEDQRRELGNPARVALRDARAQWWINLAGFVAALLGLGWSTANVQATAALGVRVFSPAWWLAWGVEPLISAALLTVMGASAYLATRAVTVTDRWVTAAQWVPLGYTVTLNCWTSLPHPVITHPAVEFLRGLIVHSVGPVVVVLLAHALPVLWAAFVRLHARTDTPIPNPAEQARSAIDLDRAREFLALVRPAYVAGEITSGVSAISRYLRQHGHRAGTPMCMWIRDALTREGTQQ